MQLQRGHSLNQLLSSFWCLIFLGTPATRLAAAAAAALQAMELTDLALVMTLQVERDHVEEHEAADAAKSGQVQIAPLLQKDLRNEVEGAELGKNNLKGQRVDHTLVAVVSVEANVGIEASLCILNLHDWHHAGYFLRILHPVLVQKHFVHAQVQVPELNISVRDADKNVNIAAKDGKLGPS